MKTERKLRILFKLYTMGATTAKKGEYEGSKRYTVKPMEKQFPPDTDPVWAEEEIYKEFGRRPEGPIHVPHQFAEVIYVYVGTVTTMDQ